MKNLFGKKEQTANPFRGLWDGESDTSTEVTLDVVQKPVETATASSATPVSNRARWGIGGAFAGLVFFLGVQVIVGTAILALLIANSGPEMLSQEEILALTTQPAVIITSSLAMWGSWLVWMWITSRRKGTKNFFADFRLKINWKKDVGLGLLIALGLIVAVNGSSLLLEAFGVSMSGSDNGSVFGPAGGAAAAIMAILIASIAGPFFEEVFFRGYILHAVRNTILNQRDTSLRLGSQSAIGGWASKHKNGIGITLSSIVFGLMHFQGVESFGQIYVVIVTGLLGAVLAYTTLRYGRLGPAIFAHMFYNGGTLLLAWITASMV